MPVGQLSGAVEMRVDDVKLGPIAACFHDERPQVNIRAQNIGSPGEDQFGVAKLFRLGGVSVPQRSGKRRAAGGRADSAVESGSAQPMEEAPIHASAVEE